MRGLFDQCPDVAQTRKRHPSRATVGSVPLLDLRLRYPVQKGGCGRGPIRRLGEDLGDLAPVRFVQVPENLVDQAPDPRIRCLLAKQPPQRVRDTPPFTQLHPMRNPLDGHRLDVVRRRHLVGPGDRLPE
jgi:hypothetical protein